MCTVCVHVHETRSLLYKPAGVCVCVCVCLTEVQHVHVIIADRSVPSTKHIDLPLLHHTRWVSDRKNKEGVKELDKMMCLKRVSVVERKTAGQIQPSYPERGGGFVACHNGFIPDGEVGIEDVQWVTAAVGLRVWTREYPSEYEELTPKHTAAVVGQRGNLTLSLRERRGNGEREGEVKMSSQGGDFWS